MKKVIDKKTLLYPHPVFVIGTYNENKQPDIAAVSWGGICCSEPPCIAISLRSTRLTYDNIMLNKAFTVNIPSTEYVYQADFSGTFTGRNIDKFKETKLTPVHSDFVNAPFVKEFPVNLHCKLFKVVEVGVHTQFIGEIIEITANEEVLDENGTPIIEKVLPFLYDSGSRHYYGIGERLTSAYSARRK